MGGLIRLAVTNVNVLSDSDLVRNLAAAGGERLVAVVALATGERARR